MTTIPLEAADHPPRVTGRQLLNTLGPLGALVLVYLLFCILSWTVPGASPFATWDNAGLMLRQTAVVGVAALGMTMIVISGGIDLSVASNIALGSVVIALVMRHFDGAAPTLAATGGIATCASAGLLIGLLVAGLRLPPFIVTLGTWGALRGFAKVLAGNTRVYPYGEATSNIDAWRDTWLYGLISTLPDERRWMIFPPGVWLLLGLALLVAAVLRYTRFGRHVFAIGSNPMTARLCGVPIARTTVLIYLIAGVLAGVAAILEFSYTGSGDPTGRSGAELQVIAAVFIGGASISGGYGTILGTLVGALIMTVVENGCTKLRMQNAWQEIVTGGIIVLAVTVDRLRHRAA